MNEKGFGSKEFIIVIAVIFVSMLIIMSLFRSITSMADSNTKIDKQEEITYQDLEKELKEAAERYQNDNYTGNIEDKDVWTLSYSMLKENGYIDEIRDIKDKSTECTGYVEFIQDGGLITYTPYLKCGSNYKTSNYNK